MGRGFGTAGTQEGPGRRVPSAPRPGTVSACCFLFGAGSGHLSSLTLTHLGSEWRALGGGQSLGDLQEPQRKVRSALISLSWAPREQLWAPGGNGRGHHGSAPCDSPETAGVGLAQDTVIRGRQGVIPEVGKALVGIGLRGGGALKSIVTGRRKTWRSGDRQWQGCEPAQGRCPTPRTHRGRSTGPVPEGRRTERGWLHSR